VDIVKTLSDDSAFSCRSEAVDVASLPGSILEPCSTDNVADTLSEHRTSSIESEFSRYRTSSLPNMGKDFNSDLYHHCSEDLTNDSGQDIYVLSYSSSSTVKPDDCEGPQDLPSNNAWFSADRSKVSRVRSADAESIGSNASTASSSSVNNQSRSVFSSALHAKVTLLKL